MRPQVRRRLGRIAVAAGLGLGVAVAPMAWALIRSTGRVSDVAGTPEARVAIVFGAQVYPNGQLSRFLEARLRVGVELYKVGKVRALVVSGDNDDKAHHETDHMREFLMAQGIPAARIVADPYGYDTYDTCARAVRVYGIRRAVLVTQSYHAPRAVAICRQLGLDAWAVGDESVREPYPNPWMRGVAREWPASFKMVLDLVSRRPPLVLGPPDDAVEVAIR